MFSRRAVWWMIFAGVFERHPGLKLVITETPGNWYPPTATELDTLHAFYDSKRDEPLNQALLANDPAGLQDAVGRIRAASDHLNSSLGFYGAIQNRVTNSLTIAQKYQVQWQTSLSDKRDADYASAITRLQSNNTQQQAALTAHAKFAKQSLRVWTYEMPDGKLEQYQVSTE